MNFVFFGTDDYSVAILEKLISDFYYPALVVSQPDRPVGRKQTLTPPPIKHVCETHQLKLIQPEKAIQALDAIAAVKPDVFIVASFGQIIPQALLDIPSKGAINVHTSLLPAYRGASPIQQAILNGDTHTGVTIMRMDAQLDHGPILLQEAIEIGAQETNVSLRARLATLGADILCKMLPDFEAGRMPGKEQDHSKATFTSMITKEQAQIAWNQDSEHVDRQVRAYQDWPLAWTVLPDGKRLKISWAQPMEAKTTSAPGTISIDKKIAKIATRNGWMHLQEVQVEGKAVISGEAFANGYKQFNGQLCKGLH